MPEGCSGAPIAIRDWGCNEVTLWEDKGNKKRTSILIVRLSKEIATGEYWETAL